MPHVKSPLQHTKALLAIRQTALRNRIGALQSAQKLGALLGVLLGVTLLIVAGFFQRDALLAIPDATTLPAGFASRGSLLPGAAALDLAFWISAFCSAVFSFRIMEFLFRDNAIRSVDDLPLPPLAMFVDRALRGLLEALAMALAPALFFFPLLLENLWVGLATQLLCFGGPLLTLGSGLGIQLFFGGTEFGKRGANTDRRAVDGYGGAGQLFLFAPAAALAASIILVMLLKLSLGELVRLESWNRATSLGVGIGLISVAASLAIGWSHFRRTYHRMLAGFREADFVGFDLPIDYQTSDFEKARAPEGILPLPARHAYRRTLLQYGRRFALIRYMYGLLWLLAIIALFQFEREALPSWAIAGLPCVLLAALANPFVRASQHGIRALSSQPGRIEARHEEMASALVVAREVILFLLPFCLVILVMIGMRLGAWTDALWIVGVMLLGGAAQVTLASAVEASFHPPAALHHVPALLCALCITWASSQTMWMGLLAAAVLCVAGILGTFASQKQQSQHHESKAKPTP